MPSGGWASSDRRERLPFNWIGLVAAVKARAGGRCEAREPFKPGGLPVRCWRTGRDVDHIVPGDDHSLSNLQLLCPYHHSRKSALEGVAARQKKSTKRPEERHPGGR